MAGASQYPPQYKKEVFKMTADTAKRLLKKDIANMQLEELQRHKVKLIDAWRESTGEYYGYLQAVRDGFMCIVEDATNKSSISYTPNDIWLSHNLISMYDTTDQREKILLNN